MSQLLTEFIRNYSTLLAAIAGPTLIGLGYIIRSKKENKKNLNEALYYLIVLWRRLREFMMIEMKDLYKQEEKSLKNNTHSYLTQEFQLPPAHEVIRKFKPSGQATSGDIGLIAGYTKAIKKISGELPVFAALLESHEKTLYSFLHSEKDIRKSLNEIFTDPNKTKEYEIIVDHAVDLSMTKTLKMIEEDIQTLSFKISWASGFKTKFAMRKYITSLKPDLKKSDQDVLQFMITLVEKFTRHNEYEKYLKSLAEKQDQNPSDSEQTY